MVFCTPAARFKKMESIQPSLTRTVWLVISRSQVSVKFQYHFIRCLHCVVGRCIIICTKVCYIILVSSKFVYLHLRYNVDFARFTIRGMLEFFDFLD